jgi:hypothetical protein
MGRALKILRMRQGKGERARAGGAEPRQYKQKQVINFLILLDNHCSPMNHCWPCVTVINEKNKLDRVWECGPSEAGSRESRINWKVKGMYFYDALLTAVARGWPEVGQVSLDYIQMFCFKFSIVVCDFHPTHTHNQTIVARSGPQLQPTKMSEILVAFYFWQVSDIP